MTDTETTQTASDRLADDRRAVEDATRRLMDSITGDWEAEGRPYVPEVAAAARTIIEATGRFAHALEKAAVEINGRAGDCYIDGLGRRTDATVEVTAMALDLLAVAGELRDFHDRAARRTQGLPAIGERD